MDLYVMVEATLDLRDNQEVVVLENVYLLKKIYTIICIDGQCVD